MFNTRLDYLICEYIFRTSFNIYGISLKKALYSVIGL